MNKLVFQVNRYTARAIGRPSARSVYKAWLAQENINGPIDDFEVDFHGLESLTASFIDELLLLIQDNSNINNLPLLHLVSDDQREWLEDISGLRDVVIKYRIDNDPTVFYTKLRKAAKLEADTMPGGLFQKV